MVESASGASGLIVERSELGLREACVDDGYRSSAAMQFDPVSAAATQVLRRGTRRLAPLWILN
jgi:hypothetical protein